MAARSTMTALLVLVALLALLPSAYSASAFPSFKSYAGKPYTVSYNQRSIRLNDEPVTFLSGSIHYPRSTPAMWPQLMKQAAADGLNMIQIYVFWNYHQPTEDVMDWTGRGNLTLFLDAIAEAGLFANLRIGPYVCAEWDYGGIPTWLAYKDGVRFRSYNEIWRDAVQQWFTTVIAQTRSYFADQGGPIVLAQVENELNGADPRYVQWNGDMAAAFNVNVPWIMCNGEAANNTINACNGNDCAGFIDSNGQSGRILIDQPALWTENEGWFESWGDSTHPEGGYSDRMPQDISYTVARWFARGGVRAQHTHRAQRSMYALSNPGCETDRCVLTSYCRLSLCSVCSVRQSHHNYYMYHGGNHYDRTYGGGLTNMYANGVNLHADGLPNEPKHTHLNRLHYAIAQVSGDLVAKEAQYRSAVVLQWLNDSVWMNGTQQVAFVYGQTVFIESSAVVFVQTRYDGVVYDMSPNTVLILQNGVVVFNTSAVQPVNVKRVNSPVWDAPLEWQVWSEGVYGSSAATAALDSGLPVYTFPRAVEMLNVTRDMTDFCWYTTTVNVQSQLTAATLTVDAASSTSLLAFVNGQYVGECNDHSHQWTTSTWQCKLQLGSIDAGPVQLSLLAVSLGIENGMNADEDPQVEHYKGMAINATVKLDTLDLSYNVWTLRPYLTGEYLGLASAAGHSSVPWSSDWQAARGVALTWYSGSFPAVSPPSGGGVYSVLLGMSGFTRGHAFVNGHDIGRYWLIPGGDGQPTQSLYHIPPDWLLPAPHSNTLTLLEEVGSTDPSQLRLYVSQLQQTSEDEQHVKQESADIAQE